MHKSRRVWFSPQTKKTRSSRFHCKPQNHCLHRFAPLSRIVLWLGLGHLFWRLRRAKPAIASQSHLCANEQIASDVVLSPNQGNAFFTVPVQTTKPSRASICHTSWNRALVATRTILLGATEQGCRQSCHDRIFAQMSKSRRG